MAIASRLLCGFSFLVLTSMASAAPSRSTELSVDWIQRSIHDHQVTGIEQLLGTFQPDSLKYHLLAYGSESQQFSSFLSPRVIVYNYDADFIMAFNGEPGSDGYNDLEILHFDHYDKKFIPEVIHFDPQGKAAPKLDAHPTECARCHQTDIRPNWDPYFHWVGFYGSEDDNVNAGSDFPNGILTGTAESAHFADFLKKQQAEVVSGKGRYRFLPPHPAERPNLHFNERVTCLNMKRLLRVFASHPEAGRLWPAIRGGSAALNRIPTDLSAGAKRSYDELVKDTEDVMEKAVRRRLNRHLFLTKEAPKGRVKELHGDLSDVKYDAENAAGWRYVFEEILHEPFRPMLTSRHDDYSLNLRGIVFLGWLLTDSMVDERTGKVVFSKYPSGHHSPRGDAEYEYGCSVAESALDEGT